MRTFIQFLTAMAVLAIVQYVTIALGITLLVVAVMAAAIHPKQAFAVAVLIAVLTLAIKRPVACAAAMGAISITAVLFNRMKPQSASIPPAPLMLTHQPADQPHKPS